MKTKYKITLLLLLLATTCIVVYFILDQPRDLGPIVFTHEDTSQTTTPSANKIHTIYKVELSGQEKDQVTKTVDAFMNDFKLPKGDFRNSYTLEVARRLNDTLMVITDPEQKESDAHAIIYLRKTDGVWQVDRNAGPWCSLEEFEQNNCQ